MKMMMRIAALFVAYGAIGLGGDWAAGLLARDAQNVPVQVEVAPVVEVVDVAPDVRVDVRPTVSSRVQVRHGGQCDFEGVRELTVPGSGVAMLEIDAGSGELHVEGQEGLDAIVVVGMLCASHEEYIDALRLSVEEGRDGAVSLRTHYPDRQRRDGRNTARIDLTVLVPAGLDVSIDDSSGDMLVSGVGDLHIDDSSGGIEVFDIQGSLRVDDSSGDLEVRSVQGDVSIDDGSGGLRVAGVQGSVVLRDGSGGVELRDIGRDVLIESDGSGGIEVRDVGGDFTVARDGSGGIRHSAVQGRIDVPRKR